MAIVISGVTVTHDESSGLQNLTATPAPAGDADDNDTSLTRPTAFTTRLATLLGATAETEVLIGTALSGYTGAAGNTGSNAFTITADPGAVITDVAFTNSSGGALSGVDSGLFTAGGVKIWLYTDTANNNILLGREGSGTNGGTANPSGEIVFAAYIEESSSGGSITGGKIWMSVFQPLDHLVLTNPDDSLDLTNKVFIGTSQDAEFSLAGAPSGQNLFLMFTKANPATFVDGNGVTRITDVTIVATGKDPANQSAGANITTGDTINTSQAGGPTTFGTNSQMIVEQEGIRFTFVTGARQNVTIPNLDQNEADLESNIDFTGMFGARTAEFDVVQLQSGKSAQVRISAFSTAVESGVNFIDGYTGDAAIGIASLRVLDTTTGAELETSTGADGGLSSTINATITGGVAFITGVKAGYTIEYTTTADHNRVLIENGAATNATGNTHADFDIGGFRLLQITTATAEIGSKMIFDDDGPGITLVPGVADAPAQVDESALGAAGATDTFAGGSLFAVDTTNAGADGSGTTSSAYTFVLGASPDSGLVDTATGAAILLRVNAAGDQVEGYFDDGGVDTVAFVFTLNTTTGVITLTQNRAVVHGLNPDPNDAETMDDGSVLLSRTDTITDSEGDSFVTDPIQADISPLFEFLDDGPGVSANNAVQLDDETETGGIAGGTGDVDPNTANTSGTLGHTFGADGAGSVDYLNTGAPSGFSYVKSGDNLLIKQGTTTVITLTLNTATGAYTVTQDAAIAHAAGPNNENDQAFTVNYRVTDGDGDTTDGTITINSDDDEPTTSANSAVQLDDETETGGIAGGTGDVDPNTANTTGTLGHAFGADGAGSFEYLNTGAPSGFSYVKSGDNLLIKQGTTTVITLTLNTATGAYTVTQDAAIAHAAGPNNENDQAFTVNYRVTDGDGDTATGSITINADDDEPTTSANNAVQLDDETETGGVAGGTGDVNPDTANTSGTLGHAFGADGGSVAYLDTGAPSGFSYVKSGNSLLIKQGTTTVITLTLNTATGAYTVTQDAAIAHATGSNENDQAFTVNYRVTDGDGDTTDGSITINADDDSPTLAFGNLVGTGTDLAQIGFWSKAAGADGPNANDLQIALTGFQLGGVAQAAANFSLTEVAPSPDGSGNYNFSGSLTGDFDNNAATPAQTIAFTLTALANGQYKLDLAAPNNSTTTTDTANGGLGAGGPDAVQTLFIPPPPATPDETVVFFSAKVDASIADIAAGIIPGATDPTEADHETPSLDAFIDPRALNVSTSGIGVSNNVLEGDADAAIGGTDESIVVNPLSLVNTVRVFVDNSVSGYKFTPGPGSGGNERLYYTAYFSDGTNSGQVLVNTDLNTTGAAPKFFDVNGGTKLIDAVQLTMAKGDVKIPNIQFITVIEGLANDIGLDFSATLTDSDGDLVTSNFSADLFSNELSTAAFDYELVGAASVSEAFNVDLASARNDYKVTGFDTGTSRDKLVLIGDAGVDAGDVAIDNSGADSIVTITETGGQTTTVLVVGVDLLPTDIFFAGV